MLRTGMRTHTCGELRRKDAGVEVRLAGWVHARRDHGGLLFLDLRDRYGLTQVVVDPQGPLGAVAERVRPEFVVAVAGRVRPRPPAAVNPRRPTGEIEVAARELTILSPAAPPPFPIEDQVEAGEEVRLKYRYLDLRRPAMQEALRFRHAFFLAVRRHLDGSGFVEVETPFLTRSTPEGARDYLVPSRIRRGSFYALPQSPQLFKQMLMVAGLDRYFQIVRCFRDEDLRANRQPEFTQLDLEMSFVGEEDVFAVIEGLCRAAVRATLGREVAIPFPRIPYRDALARYGSDKPDLRFGLELEDVTALVRQSGFRIFARTAAEGGKVLGLRVPGGGEFSRREIEGLEGVVKEHGAAGLAWAKVAATGLTGGIARFLGDDAGEALRRRFRALPGDLLAFVAGPERLAQTALGEVRRRVGRELELAEPGELRFCWVTDFPLFEVDGETGVLSPCHHPFTAPRPEDLDRLETAPGEVRARAYDLVLNGEELGGGSLRIHDPELQGRILGVLGITPDRARERFGFFLEALRYGTPPHGGIALGLDRFVMLLLGRESLREVIPFPKTATATCLLTGAPAPVDPEQLAELGLRLREPPA